MQGGVTAGTLARGAVAVVCGGLLAVSCSKKIVDVDPAAFPEGVSSPSQLVTFRDAPTFIRVTDGSTVDVVTRYRMGPGVVLGVIFDFTSADEYEIHRREGSGGFAPLKDFLLRPTRRWLDSQSEIYSFNDPAAGPLGRDYVGRGVVDGTITASSPLTNVARLRLDAVAVDQIRVITDTLRIRQDPADTTRGNIRSVTWTTVPGAAGYWLQVLQVTEQTNFGLFARGFPSPIFTGRARDYLIAYVPARNPPGATASFDSIAADSARVVMNRPIIYSQIYEVRVAAVDADGQLISVIQTAPGAHFVTVRGDALVQIAGPQYDDDVYSGSYPTGSFQLASENPPPPPPEEAPADARTGSKGRAAPAWTIGRR